MHTRQTICLVAVAAIGLSGCFGGSSSSSSSSRTDTQTGTVGMEIGETRETGRDLPEAIVDEVSLRCQGNAADAADGDPRSFRVEMPSRVDEEAIVFQVFEPEGLDCAERHPLVLHGHGFGGQRSTGRGNFPMTPIGALVDAGYTVISIDQRGFGESGGQVRVMDPDYEGRDLVQIVDWAEENLDYLGYADDSLLLGGVGGSYGGGFQYLLYHVDPDQRMKAMVPEITWHDLTYSLAPGDVTKNLWILFLSAMGDVSSGFAMDPFIRSSLLEGLLTNKFPEPAADYMHYHGPGYFFYNHRNLSVGDTFSSADYLLDIDPFTWKSPLSEEVGTTIQTERTEPYPVDVLMWQSMRDNLFPFNDAYNNYKAFNELGGDVRLLTYTFGHHYVTPSIGLVLETWENLDFYWDLTWDTLLRLDLSKMNQCGDVKVKEATIAWFDEKLRGQGSADDVITTGQDFCLTLSPGDAITVPEITVGGIDVPLQTPEDRDNVRISMGIDFKADAIPLGTLASDAVLAGIPELDLTVRRSAGFLDDACLTVSDPFLGLGTCDVILYTGIGVLREGREHPELIDEQVMPVRGLGEHESIEMKGVGERLKTGDELVLMVYTHHPTHLLAFTRDLTSWNVNVNGNVRLPLLDTDGHGLLSAEVLQ